MWQAAKRRRHQGYKGDGHGEIQGQPIGNARAQPGSKTCAHNPDHRNQAGGAEIKGQFLGQAHIRLILEFLIGEGETVI